MTKRAQYKGFIIGLIVAVAMPALAATFNLFSPATGILKGNASTYVTTAATSTDVVGTFSGTCNSGTFLRGDGSCAAAGTGSVTSVGLSVPTGFGVTGSPVTSSGTLGITTTLNGTLRGNGSGIVADSLSGVLKGNGTSAITSAVAADVYGLWSGTCNSSTFLRGDGSCQTPGGGGTVTSVGMTVPTFLSVSGSPVTTSGTLAVTLSGTALPVANGGTGTTTSTGTGNVVLSASPTLSGTITGGTFSGTLSGNGASVTSLDAGNVSAGTLAVARGGTGTTTSTGTGNVVLSASPTFTGTVTAATVAATTVTVGGNNVCQSTGTNCPSTTKISSALINAGTGAALSGSVNISSCSGSAGSYSCTFSSAYANAPACTAGVNSTSNPPLIGIANPSTGSTTVATVLASTGATSTPASVVNLICSGT